MSNENQALVASHVDHVGLKMAPKNDSSSEMSPPKDEQFFVLGWNTKPRTRCRKKLKKNINHQIINKDKRCYFNDLPDELINLIFSHLDFNERIGVERVCKRWQYINTCVTWLDMRVLNLQSKFTKSNQKALLTRKILDSILKRCGRTLRVIDFDWEYLKHAYKYPVQIVSKNCPNLESVNLSHTTITATSLRNLIRNCRYLHTIKFQACTGLEEDNLLWLFKNGRKIKYLDLSDNKNITGECFDLVNDCLETLVLSGCSQLSSTGFLYLENRKIKHLNVDYCYSLTSESLLTVIMSLNSTLIELHVCGPFHQCTGEDDAFRKIIEKCENLQRLDLEANFHVNYELIDFICKKCVHLRHLNISGTYLPDIEIQTVCQLPNLRRVFLNYLSELSDDVVIKLSQAGILEHVELRGCTSVGDIGCIALIQNCPKLKLLDVSSCKKVTNLIVDEACAVERSNNQKLEIIAGGSAIINFIDSDFVSVVSTNLCPLCYRGMDFSDDDDGDNESGNDYDQDDEDNLFDDEEEDEIDYDNVYYDDEDDDDDGDFFEGYHGYGYDSDDGSHDDDDDDFGDYGSSDYDIDAAVGFLSDFDDSEIEGDQNL